MSKTSFNRTDVATNFVSGPRARARQERYIQLPISSQRKGAVEVTVKTCHIVFLSPFDTRHTMWGGVNSVHPVFIYDTGPARSALSPSRARGQERTNPSLGAGVRQ